MDWGAAEQQRQADLKAQVRSNRAAVAQRLEAHPEENVVATNTLAARQSDFNDALQRSMDHLHRRHIAFVHIPRHAPSSPAAEEPEAPLTPDLSPRSPARTVVVPREEPKASPSRKHLRLKDATARADRSETFDHLIGNGGAKRGGAGAEGVRPAVLRSWFSTPGPQAGDATSTAERRPVLVPVPRGCGATQPTASTLGRQGMVVDKPLRRGDGYLSGEERLQLRREYAETTYGYRQLRHTRHEPPAVSAPPIVQSEGPDFSSVFVRAGDVSTFIRQEKRNASNTAYRSDDRRSHKARLGGTSKPRF